MAVNLYRYVQVLDESSLPLNWSVICYTTDTLVEPTFEKYRYWLDGVTVFTHHERLELCRLLSITTFRDCHHDRRSDKLLVIAIPISITEFYCDCNRDHDQFSDDFFYSTYGNISKFLDENHYIDTQLCSYEFSHLYLNELLSFSSPFKSYVLSAGHKVHSKQTCKKL